MTKSHRVLIAMNAARPGGSQTYALTLASMLESRGYSVHIVAKDGSWSDRTQNVAPFIAVWWQEGFADTTYPLWRRFAYRLLGLVSAIKIRLLTRGQVHAVIASQPGPIAFFSQYRRFILPAGKLFALVHGHTRAEWPPLMSPNSLVEHLDNIFTATHETQALMGREGLNATFLGNLFSAAEYWGEVPPPRSINSTRKLLFLGTLTSNKTAPLFAALRLLAASPQLSITILGDGPDLSRLQELSGTLNIGERCSFLGSIDDPRKLILSSDLVITAGRGALESLSAGLPTVVATSDGIHGLARASELEVLSAFNFTGRTPQSSLDFDDRLNQAIAESKNFTVAERADLARKLRMVGDLDPLLLALKELDT